MSTPTTKLRWMHKHTRYQQFSRIDQTFEAKVLCSNSTEFLSCIANHWTVLRAIGNQTFHSLSLAPLDVTHSLILFSFPFCVNLSDMHLFSAGLFSAVNEFSSSLELEIPWKFPLSSLDSKGHKQNLPLQTSLSISLFNDNRSEELRSLHLLLVKTSEITILWFITCSCLFHFEAPPPWSTSSGSCFLHLPTSQKPFLDDPRLDGSLSTKISRFGISSVGFEGTRRNSKEPRA